MPARYPDGDISTGLWTPTPVWAEIDDQSDVDFVTSKQLVTSDQFICHLEDFADPITDNGFIMRMRATKSATGGQVITLTWILKQGAATIKSDVWVLPDSTAFSRQDVVLSEAEVSAITDFTDLRFDVTASGSMDFPRHAAKVSALWLDAPNKVITRLHDCTFHDCTLYGE